MRAARLKFVSGSSPQRPCGGGFGIFYKKRQKSSPFGGLYFADFFAIIKKMQKSKDRWLQRSAVRTGLHLSLRAGR